MVFWNKKSYLTPRPAIQVTDIEGIINKMSRTRLQVAYSETLANLVRLCYECALRAGELTGLSVGDVFIYGKAAVKNSLGVANREIELSTAAKEIILEQVAHLRRKKHCLKAASPFFPDKSGKKYALRLLRYHLQKACPNSFVRLGEIRQSGICRYYEKAKTAGLSPAECLVRTATFAGIEIRQNPYPLIKRLTGASNIYIDEKSSS